MEKKFTGLTRKEIEITLQDFENFYNEKNSSNISYSKDNNKIIQHLLVLQVKEEERYNDNKRLQTLALRYRLIQIILLFLILIYLVIS